METILFSIKVHLVLTKTARLELGTKTCLTTCGYKPDQVTRFAYIYARKLTNKFLIDTKNKFIGGENTIFPSRDKANLLQAVCW